MASSGPSALVQPLRADVDRRAPGSAEAAQRALADFGAEMLRLVGGAEADTALSPYSLATVLAMARAGALGATGTQVDTALGLAGTAEQGGAITAIDDAVAASVATTAATKDPMIVEAANQVWIQQGLEVQPDYLAALAEQFGVDAVAAAFASDPEAVRTAINAWVAERTRDLIDELFPAGSIDSDTLLVLVNALYLKASWRTPFQPGTTAQPFTTAAGATKDVTLMTAGAPVSGRQGEGWVSARVGYIGPGLAMTILVPDAGGFAAAVEQLDAATMADAGQTAGQWTLRMPKFEIRSVPDVQGAIQTMGVTDLFTPATVDLSGIAGSKGDLVATVLVHQAVVLVDENGTEAAAATGLGMSATGMPEIAGDIVVDRPFIFWISDTTTGAPLFLGTVTDPTG